MTAPDFEMIAAALLDAVLVVSNDDEIRWVNQATESLLGHSRRALVGRRLDRVFGGAEWIGELVSHARTAHEKSLRGEGEIDASRGVIHVVAAVSLLRDRTGAPEGLLLTISDHTPRARLHGSDEQRARSDALNHLIASVAHELNNPLAGIRGAAQAVGRKLEGDEQLGGYAEMIVRQADRMAELIRSLLALETAPASFLPLNIHRVLNEVLVLEETVAANRGVTLEHEFDPSLPDVQGDAGQLEQLILNLVKNAIEACPQGSGRVAVRTRIESGFYVTRGERRVRYIAVEVIDNGPGLDAEALTRMFTPFYSNKEGGHGLGLAIASRIAGAHDGHIRAENQDAGGARFTVLLPVAEAPRT